jgi:hypothetical protein
MIVSGNINGRLFRIDFAGFLKLLWSRFGAAPKQSRHGHEVERGHDDPCQYDQLLCLKPWIPRESRETEFTPSMEQTL